jgi:ketosteroid isomerase-like protein
MTTQDETRKVVESYFAAWTTKNIREARPLLANDIEVSGPTGGAKGLDAFLPALENFAAMTKAARIVDLVVNGDRAALLYDCDLPEPVGTLRIASFFRVEKGQIRTYEILFDATEFRKLIALKGGKE